MLEDRTLLAAAAFDPVSGVLTIDYTSTDATAELLTIRNDANIITLSDDVEGDSTIATSSLSRIVVRDAGGGSDQTLQIFGDNDENAIILNDGLSIDGVEDIFVNESIDAVISNVTISAESISIQNNAEITTGDMGTIDVTAAQRLYMFDGNFSVVDGDLTVSANLMRTDAQDYGSDGGIFIRSFSSISTSGSGNILLVGHGGSRSSGSGIELADDGVIQSTGNGANAGAIQVIGNSGNVVPNPGSQSSSASGIEFSERGRITSRNSDIEIIGVASSDGSNNFGVLITGSANQVSSQDGDIQITGTGMDLSGNPDSQGIIVSEGSQIVGNSITLAGAVESGRIFESGASIPARINLQGSLILSENSTFVVDFSSHTDRSLASLIQVNGTVTLNEAELALGAFSNHHLPAGQEIVIIDNDGVDPVIGTFAENRVVVGSFTYFIGYNGGDGNDVFLRAALNGQGLVVEPFNPAAINAPLSHSISGDFDNSSSSNRTANDLFFWDPVSGANRIVFSNEIVQSNPFPATALNGNDFTEVIVGDFDGAGGDDFFFWNPRTGRNRLIHSNGTNGNIIGGIETNVIPPSAINGNDFTTLVIGSFDAGGTDDLFFWHSQSGRNRLIHLEVTIAGNSSNFGNLQTNVIPANVVNGSYEDVIVGQFSDDELDELLFFNLETGQNRLVSFNVTIVGEETLIDKFQTNWLTPPAFNGNAFQRMIAADLNGDGLDGVFAWNPVSGSNRIAFARTNSSRATAVYDDQIAVNSINGSFERVVRFTAEAFSVNDNDDLFFWDADTGQNRIAAF